MYSMSVEHRFRNLNLNKSSNDLRYLLAEYTFLSFDEITEDASLRYDFSIKKRIQDGTNIRFVEIMSYSEAKEMKMREEWKKNHMIEMCRA